MNLFKSLLRHFVIRMPFIFRPRIVTDVVDVFHVCVDVSAYTIFPLSHFVQLHSSLMSRVGWSVRDTRFQFNHPPNLLSDCPVPLIDN